MSKRTISAEEYEQKMADHLARRVYLEKKTFIGEDFSQKNISAFIANNCKFIDCWFSSTRIEQAYFGSGVKETLYRNCTFDGVKIKSLFNGLARFEQCSFRNVRITGWSLQHCDLVDCVFTGEMKSGRTGGSFWGAPIPVKHSGIKKSVNEVKGNDFSACKLVGMDFRRGIDLRLQKLPEAADYLYVEDGRLAVKRAQREVSKWKDEESRRLGNIVLDLELKKIDDGQEQIFMCIGSGAFVSIWPSLREAFLSK